MKPLGKYKSCRKDLISVGCSLHSGGIVLSCFTHVQLFVTPRTIARQAPLSMGFSRQDYWTGLLCPFPGSFSDPGIEPVSQRLLHWQLGSLPLVPPGKTEWLWTIFSTCIKSILHFKSSINAQRKEGHPKRSWELRKEVEWISQCMTHTPLHHKHCLRKQACTCFPN